MTRGLLIAIFVALVAVCQVWLVTAGQLRGDLDETEHVMDGATESEIQRELEQLDQLERFLVRELTYQQLNELTEDQIEQMKGMTEEERKLFIFECFGDKPSATPSASPSASPSLSHKPTLSIQPSGKPSQSPSDHPTISNEPSAMPTVSRMPSTAPSSAPPSSSPTSNCFFATGGGHHIMSRVRSFFGGGPEARK